MFDWLVTTVFFKVKVKSKPIVFGVLAATLKTPLHLGMMINHIWVWDDMTRNTVGRFNHLFMFDHRNEMMIPIAK